MSKRSNRASYPDYVKFSTRFDPGSIQRETGLPASLIHKARRGEVESFSESTLTKFKQIYDTYWQSRLDRAGVTPDNWSHILTQDLKDVRDITRGAEKSKRLDRTMEKGGIQPVEREKLLVTDTEKEIRERIDKNRETAERIAEKRRERDKNLPNYSPSWHNVNDILKQMARDTSRLPQDWDWIAKYGSPKRKIGAKGGKANRRDKRYEH